jgi:hypothetical protein
MTDARQSARLDDFANDITRRARWARDHNDGRPESAWSTGERLTVALVVGDQATLDAERYTRQEAAQRLAGDLSYYGYPADADTWLSQIRATLAAEETTAADLEAEAGQ